MKRKILLDCRASDEIKNKLYQYGFEIIPQKEFPLFDAPVSAHPDMNYLKIGGKAFSSEKIYENHPYKKLSYPDDVKLNAATVGNDFICREKSVCEIAYNHARENRYNIINVNQGYVKCNIAIVSEELRAVITEDENIAKVLLGNNYYVLKLDTHDVALSPYDYGFIGGASGLIEKNTLAFCGSIKKHSEYQKIKNFCEKFGTEVVSLSDEPLYDYGSVILL